MQDVLLTLYSMGADLGDNFTLSVDSGTVTPTGVTRDNLTSGYTVSISDTGATAITVCSLGVCENCLEVPIVPVTTTTTTTTTLEPDGIVRWSTQRSSTASSTLLIKKNGVTVVNNTVSTTLVNGSFTVTSGDVIEITNTFTGVDSTTSRVRTCSLLQGQIDYTTASLVSNNKVTTFTWDIFYGEITVNLRAGSVSGPVKCLIVVDPLYA